MFGKTYDSYNPPMNARPGAFDHLSVPSLQDGKRVPYTPPKAHLSTKRTEFTGAAK